MCELNGIEMDAATQSNLRAINTSFDNVTSIFDAAIKRERRRSREIKPVTPNDDDPPPRKSA